MTDLTAVHKGVEYAVIPNADGSCVVGEARCAFVGHDVDCPREGIGIVRLVCSMQYEHPVIFVERERFLMHRLKGEL